MRKSGRDGGLTGRGIVGRGMFEAFPPSEEDGGAAAVGAMRQFVERIRATGAPEDILPCRFDLAATGNSDTGGDYGEHYWQMRLSPARREGRLVAIHQLAQGVTACMLKARLAELRRRGGVRRPPRSAASASIPLRGISSATPQSTGCSASRRTRWGRTPPPSSTASIPRLRAASMPRWNAS
jgi:hypothetical protein